MWCSQIGYIQMQCGWMISQVWPILSHGRGIAQTLSAQFWLKEIKINDSDPEMFVLVHTPQLVFLLISHLAATEAKLTSDVSSLMSGSYIK